MIRLSRSIAAPLIVHLFSRASSSPSRPPAQHWKISFQQINLDSGTRSAAKHDGTRKFGRAALPRRFCAPHLCLLHTPLVSAYIPARAESAPSRSIEARAYSSWPRGTMQGSTPAPGHRDGRRTLLLTSTRSLNHPLRLEDFPGRSFWLVRSHRRSCSLSLPRPHRSCSHSCILPLKPCSDFPATNGSYRLLW